MSEHSIQSDGGSGGGSGVAGRVIDQAGAPVAGAVVMPRSNDSPPQEIPEIAVMTNHDGRYQWSLPPGRYSFTVHHDSYAPLTSQPLTVTPGHISSLDITLPHPRR